MKIVPDCAERVCDELGRAARTVMLFRTGPDGWFLGTYGECLRYLKAWMQKRRTGGPVREYRSRRRRSV